MIIEGMEDMFVEEVKQDQSLPQYPEQNQEEYLKAIAYPERNSIEAFMSAPLS